MEPIETKNNEQARSQLFDQEGPQISAGAFGARAFMQGHLDKSIEIKTTNPMFFSRWP